MPSADLSDQESEVLSSSGKSAHSDEELADQRRTPSTPAAQGMHGLPPELEALTTRLKLSREQQLRKLLSQRSLGHSRAVDDPPFVMKPPTLYDDDAVLFSSFCNAALFSELCDYIEHQSTGDTPPVVAVEAALAQTNPLFCVRYALPVARCAVARETWYAAAPDARWWQTVLTTAAAPRHLAEQSESTATQSGTRLRKRARDGEPAVSASAGLVAQSSRAWEQHLATELSREGETLESFRQASNKTSYMDKTRFKQRAEQQEYQRELALQARARDLAEKRSIRRGEVTE